MSADANAEVIKNSNDKYIPTIDLREYFDAKSHEEKVNLVEKVRKACLEHGFFQVVGHGVPIESQQAMLKACKTFFDLPVERKRQISLYKYSWRRGYEGPGQQQANDPHHGDYAPDAKEGFFVGKELPLHAVDFQRGPNVWPPWIAESEFRQPVMEYYNHVHKVGYKVMEVLAVGLGHSPSLVESFTRDAAQFLKLLKYPAHTWTDKRKFGSGQHTDYGGLTILLQDPGQDGLEVWHEGQQKWIELPALEDKFVINLGDMVARWTGGTYKSTLHRVINKTGGERYAVPAFWNGDLDAKNPLDPSDPSDETVGDFIKKKFYKGYGLKDETPA